MLSSWFDHRVTVQRQTSSQDASGGQVFGTWTAVTGCENIPCAIYDNSQANPTGQAGARRDWEGDYVIVTDQKLAINPGDRLYNVTNNIVYDITATLDHSNAKVGNETVFTIRAKLRRVTSGNQ